MGERHDAAVANAAANLTLVGMHRALKRRVQEIVAPFDGLKTKTGSKRAPQVIDGWLPPKQGSRDEQLPAVLVRPRSGSDSEQAADQTADAKVEIIIATLDDSDDGWLDVLAIIDALRLSFDEEPIVDQAYEQVGPLTWEIPEEQPRPEWYGRVTTSWVIPRPRRVEALNAPDRGDELL